MNSTECAKRSRKKIRETVKTRLLQHCGFSCSICGKIPIVFHHIEEWAKSHSNDEEALIPICPICHAKIHGEGGPPIDKQEQYSYKHDPPERPRFLRDTLIPRQRPYSFFVGSNFIGFGTNIPIFNLPDGYNLLSINVENNRFRLTVLAEANNENKSYLIKDNELTLDTEDIWDMRYSGSRLKIIRIDNDEETVFIDMNFHEDAVILREMNTSFNDKPFRVYKLRKPWTKQIAKIENKIRELEREYYRLAAEIDNRPKTGKTFGGRSVDVLLAETNKQNVKHQMQQWLSHEFYKNFNWDWWYYQYFLWRVLEKSPVFGDESSTITDEVSETVAKIKAKYKEFDELENIVVEYGGQIWIQNFYGILPPNNA